MHIPHVDARPSVGAQRCKRICSRYLDRRLPRYTSYPTAVQFGVRASRRRSYERWLKALPHEASVSVYLHVPFCAELCLYCGCHTTVARRYAPIAAYVELLEREISVVGRLLARPAVTQIHWGGGTPTILSPQDLLRVTAALRASFTITPATETAIEIDPRSLTREHIAALADIGVAPRKPGRAGFRTARATSHKASTKLRTDGSRGGWPARRRHYRHQSRSDVRAAASDGRNGCEDVHEQALALEPDRMALFGYAHVPWMKRHQKLIPEDALPGSVERFGASRAAGRNIRRRRAIGGSGSIISRPAKTRSLSASAKAGCIAISRATRPMQSPNLIGFGPSAIGSLPDGYVQNTASDGGLPRSDHGGPSSDGTRPRR